MHPTPFDPSSLQHARDLTSLASFVNAVKRDYVDGKPRHLSRPDESGFKVIPYHEFKNMTAATVQGLLRSYQCLAVTGMPVKGYKFDKVGLRTLKPMRGKVEVSDLSILDEVGCSRIRSATMGQLLEAAQHPDGNILNGLNFPMHTASLEPYPPYASDLFAWEETAEEPGFEPKPIPIGHLRWGLAAIGGSWTLYHLDTDGTGAFVDTLTGTKIWFFQRDTEEQWRNPRATFPSKLKLHEGGKYPVEAIVLQPGTRL